MADCSATADGCSVDDGTVHADGGGRWGSMACGAIRGRFGRSSAVTSSLSNLASLGRSCNTYMCTSGAGKHNALEAHCSHVTFISSMVFDR